MARVARPVADFARVDFARVAFAPDFAAVLVPAAPDFAAAPRLEVPEREAPAFVLVARLPVERDVLDFAREPVDPRPPVLLRAEPEDDEPDDPSSVDHLPVMTRCAASATASAMMLPSFVALDIMLVAACEAVSAASRPASRILRRALGLALIAAAAAANPAASISLLIAALAIRSTVSLPDEEPEEPDPDEPFPEELFLADFAIVNSSLCDGKTLKGRNGSLMMAAASHFSPNVKGTIAVQRRCPSTWSAAGSDGRSSSFRLYEHPSPTSVLNHETSDHLLSLR